MCRVWLLGLAIVFGSLELCAQSHFSADIKRAECPSGDCFLVEASTESRRVLIRDQRKQSTVFPFLPAPWESSKALAIEDFAKILPVSCLGAAEAKVKIEIFGETHDYIENRNSTPSEKNWVEQLDRAKAETIHFFVEGYDSKGLSPKSYQYLEEASPMALADLALKLYASTAHKMAYEEQIKKEAASTNILTSLKSYFVPSESQQILKREASMLVETFSHFVSFYKEIPRWAKEPLYNALLAGGASEGDAKSLINEFEGSKLRWDVLKGKARENFDAVDQVSMEAYADSGAALQSSLLEWGKKNPKALFQISQRLMLAILSDPSSQENFIKVGTPLPAWSKELGDQLMTSLNQENSTSRESINISEIIYSLVPLHLRNLYMHEKLVSWICEHKPEKPVVVLVGAMHAYSLQEMLKRSFPNAIIKLDIIEE